MQTEANLQLNSTVLELKTRLQKKEDVEKNLAQANEAIKALQKANTKNQKDLEIASDYLLD